MMNTSLFGAMNIAGTGMFANRKWMDAVADNLANMNNVQPVTGEAFRQRFVVAQANNYGQPAGVHTYATWGNREGRMVQMPDHPYANAGGYVRVPDIDMAGEMTALIMAQRSYQANLAVVDRSKACYEAAIGIGK